MKRSSLPKPPEEDPQVKALRVRQIEDLADLDEEENRRLKAATRQGRGIRAFRRPSRGEAGSQVQGRTGRIVTGGGSSGGSAGGGGGRAGRVGVNVR